MLVSWQTRGPDSWRISGENNCLITSIAQMSDFGVDCVETYNLRTLLSLVLLYSITHKDLSLSLGKGSKIPPQQISRLVH